MECSAAECEKPASEGTLCAAHARYRRRNPGKPFKKVREYGLSTRKRLEVAALALAEASSEDDKHFQVLWKLLRMAALNHVRKNVRKPTDTTSRG